jgi:alpha-tubulin suppressor-like RCC1 family protein
MGNGNSLAVKTDGTLWAWGRATFGQLGDNTSINKSSPIQIGALTVWGKTNDLRNSFNAGALF